MNSDSESFTSETVTSDVIAHYYADGAVWAEIVIGELRRSRRIAWRLAVAAVLVALLNAAALFNLHPLRQSMAYAITIDAQHAPNPIVRSLKPGVLHNNPAYTRSEVARYVTAREGYASFRIRKNYHFVELLSSPSIRRNYSRLLQRTSGASPFTLYPPRAIIDVDILSVSLLDESHALVRYTKTRGDLNGAQPEQAQAVVGFTYVRGPMREPDRYDDPLGFQVVSYSSQPV